MSNDTATANANLLALAIVRLARTMNLSQRENLEAHAALVGFVDDLSSADKLDTGLAANAMVEALRIATRDDVPIGFMYVACLEARDALA